MSTIVEDLDLLQRIIAAAQRPVSEIYDSSGDAPFEPETQKIIGEVPMSLRGLHNLLHEIGVTHNAATTAAHACEATFQMELQKVMQLDPRPEEMPAELKTAKEAVEAAIAHARQIDTLHNIVRDLFFTSLESHFPDLQPGKCTLLSSWRVAAIRGRNSSDALLESILEAVMSTMLVGTVYIHRED